MAAVSFIVLLLGGASQVLDLTAVVVCAMIIFVVHTELRYSSLLTYAVAATLAFLILPNKEIAVEYLIFAVYPILKPIFEKAGKFFGKILKIAFMVASSAALTLLFRYVFMTGDVWYIDVAFGVTLVACYMFFDIALTRFDVYYRFKLRHQLRIDRFFH